jgi:hypothetical protein
MFWLDNLNVLTAPILIPDINMTFEDKLNAIIRGLLFLGIIFTLVFNDSKYILFVLIIMIISIVIYNYQFEKNRQIEKYLNENDLDIINNKKCIKPTKSNPFMNPNILDSKYDENNNMFSACSIENSKINNNMNKYFNENVFRETDDLYNKSLLPRQFYTMPSTTIPNEREKLGDWLYNTGPSCKENGLKCYENIYTDLRSSIHN